MGMMGSLNLSSQLRASGALNYAQQRMNQGKMRQQLSQQNPLSSAQVQNLPRSIVSGIYEPPVIWAGSEWTTEYDANFFLVATVVEANANNFWSCRTAHLHFISNIRGSHRSFYSRQQQLASSSELHQNSMSLTPQQLSQLVQQQSPMGHSQLQPQQQQQQLQQQSQQQPPLHQQQQQSPRIPGSTGQKSLSFTGSQQDATVSGTTTPGGSSSQGTEATNQLLGKRKIQDLVSQVDSHGSWIQKLKIADDFIDSPNEENLDESDILVHGKYGQRKIGICQCQDSRVEQWNHQRKAVLSLMESLQSGANMNNNTKEMIRPGISNPVGVNTRIKALPSSEQLVSQVPGSQTLQQITQY